MKSSLLYAAALLAVMAALMFGAARQDSATVDEANELATGYLFWRGIHTQLGKGEHPPLSRLIAAFPLLGMDVKLSPTAEALIEGRFGYPWTLSWTGAIRPVGPSLTGNCQGRYVKLPPLGDMVVEWQCRNSYPMSSWYASAAPEEQLFGKIFLYEGLNDGDAMLLAGRVMEVILALLTGVLIFVWTRNVTGQDWTGLIALSLWSFNPIALAYGHLIKNDIGVTLGIALSVYCLACYVEKPSRKNAALAGVATGMALLMKLTTLMLAPIFVAVLLVARKRMEVVFPELCRDVGVFVLAGWCVSLVGLMPWAAPPPPPTSAEMAVFSPPVWFTVLRPVLVPSWLFKSIAQALAHSQGGTESYLLGQWSRGGWWYYFPFALFLKSSMAFIVLLLTGAWWFLRRAKKTRPLEWIAWLTATLYLLLAMTSGINIGVRHLLPMLPLLCVGIGSAVHRFWGNSVRIAVLVLISWQAISALCAYPMYLQFMNELCGGAPNGHLYLLDSNFDWGQDAKRLKKFLDDHRIDHVYMDYYGNQFSTEYLGIRNTRVNAETARQIHNATLVVSASQLLRPEWDWLRKSRAPNARIANTLFVYHLP